MRVRPKKLKVLGAVYDVTFKKGPIDTDYAGTCDISKKKIDVSLDYDVEATLLHELIHAVIYESALNQCNISSDAKEIICEQVSRVIVDNFKLSIKK